jgi:hypothetical protein
MVQPTPSPRRDREAPKIAPKQNILFRGSDDASLLRSYVLTIRRKVITLRGTAQWQNVN